MDARIALGLTPFTLPDPIEPFQKALTLQSLMGQQDAQNLQLQQGQHNFQKQLATEALLKGATTPQDIISRLMSIDPGTAVKLQAEQWKARKDQMDATKTATEQGSQLAYGFMSLPDDQKAEQYPNVVQSWNQLGLKQIPLEPWSDKLRPGWQLVANGGLSPKDAAERAGYARAVAAGNPTTPAAIPNAQSPALSALTSPQPQIPQTPLQNDVTTGLEQTSQALPIVRGMRNSVQQAIDQGASPSDIWGTPLSDAPASSVGGSIPSPVRVSAPVNNPAVSALTAPTITAAVQSAQTAPVPTVQTPPVDVSATPLGMTTTEMRRRAVAAWNTGTPEGSKIYTEMMAAANSFDQRLQEDQAMAQRESHQTAEERLRQQQINESAERVKQGWLTVDPFGTLRDAATNFASKGKSTALGRPGADQVIGQDYLQSIPKPLADQVRALAEGRMAFPAGMALKSPYWQNMLQMVSQYDPSFDAVNFNARAATRKDFTSGTAAKSATALNTVIGHLDTLSHAADALNNTNFPAYNSITNWMANNVGDPRVKQFDNTRKAVVDELTRVWRGTGGSEGDIKSWTDTIGAANSPAQLHGVIKNIGDLLESRINALNDQYARGMGTTEQPLELVTPKSRELLNRLEQKATGQSNSRIAPTSGTPLFAVNPQTNERIMSNDGGKTWQPAK